MQNNEASALVERRVPKHDVLGWFTSGGSKKVNGKVTTRAARRKRATAHGEDLAGVKAVTLINLRWLAIFGQVAAIGIVHQYLRFDAPLVPLSVGVLASIVFNAVLTILFAPGARVTSRQGAFQLCFDQIQLAVLLYFTGGLQNPFSVMMLLPLTISATMLSGRATVFMLALAVACLLVLTRAHWPLPWSVSDPINLSPTYSLGLWTALSLSMLFIAAYAYRVSADARKRTQALVALQAALNREQRLSAVGSLAAAAAHELGTPLGTIALIAKDFKGQRAQYPQFSADFDLLEQESERCREILTDISTRADEEAEHFQRMSILAIINEMIRQYDGRGIPIDVTASPMAEGQDTPPVVARGLEMRHGIANFIANAVRFAASRVEIDVSWDDDAIHIVICDDGPGFPDDLLPMLGEPFLESHPGRDGVSGMGLGVFIAKTLLERTGAVIEFENDEPGGAVVDISWNRDDIEEEGGPWDKLPNS